MKPHIAPALSPSSLLLMALDSLPKYLALFLMSYRVTIFMGGEKVFWLRRGPETLGTFHA